MWPTLIEVGSDGAGVHTYGLLVLSGFCAAFLMVHLRSMRIGFHPDRLVPLYVAAAVGGLLGARLLYAVAVEPAETLANPGNLFRAGGFAYYGGVLGGAAAVGALAAAFGMNAWKFMDVVAPALVAGLGIGRFGCFFAGCCHGAPAPVGPAPTALLPDGLLKGQIWLSGTFPFVTLEFHAGVGRLLHEPLYPTQLWSAAVGCALAVVLWTLWSKRRFDGQLAALMLIVEPIARIAIESFRADHRGYAVSWEVSSELAAWLPGMASAGESLQAAGEGVRIGLTTSQTIGLGMIAVGLAMHLFRWNAGIAPEIAVRSAEDEEDELLLGDRG